MMVAETRPAGWLLKTEPSGYSWNDLMSEGKTTWDGVRNSLALSHMQKMKRGDRVLIYHTGGEKAIIGLARVTRDACPDPNASDPRIVVVDLAPERVLKTPVTLSEVKSRKEMAQFPLVRLSRLSVMPVSISEWALILEMAGEKG